MNILFKHQPYLVDKVNFETISGDDQWWLLLTLDIDNEQINIINDVIEKKRLHLTEEDKELIFVTIFYTYGLYSRKYMDIHLVVRGGLESQLYFIPSLIYLLSYSRDVSNEQNFLIKDKIEELINWYQINYGIEWVREQIVNNIHKIGDKIKYIISCSNDHQLFSELFTLEINDWYNRNRNKISNAFDKEYKNTILKLIEKYSSCVPLFENKEFIKTINDSQSSIFLDELTEYITNYNNINS